MYLLTSRLQYNLHLVGVFQTAHSVKLFSGRSLLGSLYQQHCSVARENEFHEDMCLRRGGKNMCGKYVPLYIFVL